MLGALIGDICGSRFEWKNNRSKQFVFFDRRCMPTDDSIMTLAVAEALLQADGKAEILPEKAAEAMQRLGRAYPRAGYGGSFFNWLYQKNPQPYNSWGNGAGMRVSPCAWAAESLDEALALSDAVTSVTHNHPEGIKGARAVTAAVWMARNGGSREEIRENIVRDYYPLDFTLDQIRPVYRFDVSCQGSVPQAIEAFLEADGFEDAVRGAVSIGGDSDTIAAMTGAMAEAFWGIPEKIREEGMSFLDERQKGIVVAFEERYGYGTER